jgi:hypothetical protein
MTRFEHKGNARKAVFAAGISSTDLTHTGDDLSGWPDGSIGPFWGVANKGTPSEEKILYATRTQNTLTVFSDAGGNGRGRDDTTAQSHDAGATLEHVWTATEADQANSHVNEGDGAHGYPPKATLVTTTGAQVIDGKTLTDATLSAPVVTAPVITGGTVTDATKITLVGVQEEGEFRAREIMLSTADPTPADGEDGAVWMKYV